MTHITSPYLWTNHMSMNISVARVPKLQSQKNAKNFLWKRNQISTEKRPGRFLDNVSDKKVLLFCESIYKK